MKACEENQLDSILTDVGEFGKFQKLVTFLLLIAVVINYFSIIIYAFETLQINHRCLIVGCDTVNMNYKPEWLPNAVPFENGKPARCTKFQRVQNTSCSISDFNSSVLETCERFIYETSEISIMQDFNLHCDDNVKTLTFVGTINGLGKLFGLPLIGYLSDKLGRKRMLIISALATGVLGVARSFSTSYIMFLMLEFFESFSSCAIYPCIHLLLTEPVGPKKRSLMTALQFFAFSAGGVILGAVAWQVQSWRLLLRILYPLNFVLVFYYWLIPESIRWLFVNNKHKEVERLLRKVAKVNKTQVPEEKLRNLSIRDAETLKKVKIPLKSFFRSKLLVTRCIICSFCWISCIFVFYGLTINSTTLSDNHYLDFMLTSAIETPAYLVTYFFLNKIGRKILLSGSFFLSGLSCIGFIVLPINVYWVQLAIYLIGKFGISIVSISIYTLTNEMFPTSLRQTLFSVCSMFGRIGNILVPQLILLQEIWVNLPILLFAILTITSGFLILLLPETKNTIYPNTIKEAETIGKIKIQDRQNLSV